MAIRDDIWKLNTKVDGLVCCKAAVVKKISKPILEFKQINVTQISLPTNFDDT